MSSTAELDLDRLLAPIPGSDPAGQPLPFQIKEKLDEARKEVNPELYPEDDPNRPELKKADWPVIVRLCDETLTRTSKDLLTAVRLTEALTKQHAFAGLPPALKLLAGLFESCWERMYPAIEDDDLEPRAGPLNWLDDAGRGGRFPATLRTLPVLGPTDKAYSYTDWERARDGTGSVVMDVLDKAIVATPRELCQARLDDITASLAGLSHLTDVLNTRLGAVAPGMVTVKQALQQCEILAKQALQPQGPRADRRRGAGRGGRTAGRGERGGRACPDGETSADAAGPVRPAGGHGDAVADDGAA